MLCSKYALQPNRFIRSTLLLAKALAWLRSSRKVELEHVRRAVKYTLPLRLIVVNESLKHSVPTVKALIEQCLRDFDDWISSIGCKFKAELANALNFIESLRFDPDIDHDYMSNDPVLYKLALDLANSIQKIKSELLNLIPSLSRDEVKVLMNSSDYEIQCRAEERFNKLMGIKVLNLKRNSVEFKRLLKILFIEKIVCEGDIEKLLTSKTTHLSKEWGEHTIEIKVNGPIATVKIPIKLLSKLN